MPRQLQELAKDADHPFETLLETVLQSTPRTLSEDHRSAFNAFLPHYFGSSQLKDLEWMNPEDLNGLALSHWQLLIGHEINQTSIRLLNPSLTSEGWQSPNTILELVTPDQPHLVASIRSSLLARSHNVKLIIHPILDVVFDDKGVCTGIETDQAKSGSVKLTAVDSNNGLAIENHAHKVSVMHLQIEHVCDEQLDKVEACIKNTLAVLDVVRQHTPAMHEQLAKLSEQCTDDEQSAFFNWLSEKQFSCLGIAELVPERRTKSQIKVSEPLGLLATFNEAIQWDVANLIPEDAFAALQQYDQNVIICKADRQSPIIRSDYADLVLLLHRTESGVLSHISCVVGLFVTTLQAQAPDSIPLLREHIDTIINQSNANPESHDGRALASVLRGFPRDMLLQTSSDSLLNMAERIVSLHERAQIRLFHSSDPMGRFCNCLVYIPRDTYSRELRLDIESILTSLIEGKSTQFHTEFSSESALARLHFVIQKEPPLKRELTGRI